MIDKRIKQRYGVECSCKNYLPYSEILKSLPYHTITARILRDEECYNCHLIRRYGSYDPKIIKQKKIEEAQKRVQEIKTRKEKNDS